MTIATEHSKPPADIDGYDEFEVDFGRALRFALMDPKLAVDLTPEQRHVGQVIGNFMPKNGKGLNLGVRKIADATGYGRTMVAKHIIGLRIWRYLNVMSPAKKGGSTTFETNISKEIALTKWCEAKRKEQQQLEREVSALEADSEMSRLSIYGPDSATGVSTPIADSRYEVSAPTVHLHGESVRSEPESVHPKGGHALSTLNTPSKLPDPQKVVPLSDDAEFIKRKLEPFGEHGHRWAEEFAKFMGISIPEAVSQMELAALSHGHFNVMEAIREAASVRDVKSPKGLWKHLLAEQSKHGKRAMPKQAVESQVRILSMAERSFR